MVFLQLMSVWSPLLEIDQGLRNLDWHLALLECGISIGNVEGNGASGFKFPLHLGHILNHCSVSNFLLGSQHRNAFNTKEHLNTYQ